ncbi:MBL fold metallo-hydrolase [Sinomonas sp. RB5]
MFTQNAAPGIHRLEHAATNLYVVDEGGSLLLVDAGFPSSERLLAQAVRELGRGPEDIRALVLTHGHFDHIGSATRLRARLGIPVYAHAADHDIAAHPYRYRHERSALLYPVRYPKSLLAFGQMAAAGAFAVPGLRDVRTLDQDALRGLPGSPTLLQVPGHTAGSVALWFPQRDAVITGDALVTLDPYTGGRGPQIVAQAATADSETALASLGELASTRASILLPGHGEPWMQGAEAAVARALEVSRH